MTCVDITETGLLALVSLCIGFLISFCKQAEQSRCKDIMVCWGLVKCKRQLLNDDTILQLEAGEETKTNNE